MSESSHTRPRRARRVLDVALAWVRERPRQVVAVLALGAIAMQLPVWLWYVDDAAISMAFAEHLVAGEGLVAYPGGERVEGYSNPLWVALLALGGWIGLGGFTTARLLGCLFAALTLPLVVALAARAWARSERPGSSRGPAPVHDVIPLLAGLLLVTSAAFSIWNASGLENSLFNLLLAAAALTLLREADAGGRPWSALCFFGLAITRPEGLLYAAVGAFFAVALPLRAGRGLRPGIAWLALFATPLLVYHAARFAYFAWPLPNTYYAKLGEGGGRAFDWNGPGWQYLRKYAGLATLKAGPGVGQGYLLPVTLIGALGLQRRAATLLVVGSVGVALLVPPPAEITGWNPLRFTLWETLRVGLLVGAAALVPLLALALGRPATALLCALAAAAASFAVLARGDWMAGYRLLSMAQIPLAVLFACGVGEIYRALARLGARPRMLVAVGLVALFIAPQIRAIAWFSGHAATSPKSVKRRVDYWRQVSETLQLDAPTLLDVDMGATLLWSDTPVIDIAGLVDVPIARQHYDSRFQREYVLEERDPELVHLHKGWARRSGLTRLPEWQRYVQIPAYPIGSKSHGGNHVRRDLLFATGWTGDPARARALEGELTLLGFELGPAAAPGESLTLWLALARSPESTPPEAGETLLEVRLAAGERVLASADLEPAHGWLPPAKWQADEIFTGRYAIPLPATTAPGRYDLWIRPVVVRDGERAAGPEVRFSDVALVISAEAFQKRQREELLELSRAATHGECVPASERWAQLRSSSAALRRRDSPERRAAHATLADCWARRAAEAPERERAVALLARARELDHHCAALAELGGPLADALYRDGRAALAEARALRRARPEAAADELATWEAAYAHFRDVLRIDASRSWARRYAEEARAQRLGLVADSAYDRARAQSQGAKPERKAANTAP